jgi:gliding motility-associated-like protein
MRHILFLLFGILLTAGLRAQVNPPELRCISVENNGDITINWVIPGDPNGYFQRYLLYVSVGGSPFIAFDSLPNILQNVYTHTGASFGSVTTNYRYFFRSVFDSGSGRQLSTPSDTLSPIHLTLTVAGNVSGQLNWNAPRSNPLPTWGSTYTLYRNFQGLPATVRYNPLIGQTAFRDTAARCNDVIFYSIELPDASGCISKSNIDSALLQDNLGPAVWDLACVSVDSLAGATQLIWNEHSDKTTLGYSVGYTDPAGVNTFIDTVGAGVGQYLDNSISRSPYTTSQCYALAAFDSCFNTQGAGKLHCTVHLTRSYDLCAGEVYLKWTHYVGWPQIANYNVYMRINSDPYKMMGTVNGNVDSFVVRNIEALNVYSFYIEAVSQTGKSSFSNVLGTRFTTIEKPKYLVLRSVGVTGDNTAQLRVYADKKAPINRFMIYRGLQREGPFMKVGETENTNSDTIFKLYDETVDLSKGAYTYFVTAVDSCGNAVIKSNVARSIFLRGEGRKYDYTNGLTWQQNYHWDSTKLQEDLYFLYRGIYADYEDEPIKVHDPRYNSHEDYIKEYLNEGARFCYTVAYKQYRSALYPFADSVLSNQVCLEFESDVHTPDAFSPNRDGINETWRPVVTFVEEGENYLLRIFDRWGHVIFETSDPLEGWAGASDEGVDYPSGMYMYQLFVKTVNGSEIKQRGKLILMR